MRVTVSHAAPKGIAVPWPGDRPLTGHLVPHGDSPEDVESVPIAYPLPMGFCPQMSMVEAPAWHRLPLGRLPSAPGGTPHLPLPRSGPPRVPESSQVQQVHDSLETLIWGPRYLLCSPSNPPAPIERGVPGRSSCFKPWLNK